MEILLLEIVDLQLGSQQAQLVKIPRSPFYYLRSSIEGKRIQVSTKCKEEGVARDWATDYLINLLGRVKEGKPALQTSFKQVALDFLENEHLTKAIIRNSRHISNARQIINRWLIPYFHDECRLTIEEIRPKHINEFLVWRNKGADSPRQIGTAPAAQTLKHYLQILRRIMKFTIREELIKTLPLFPEIGRQKHTRAWFEPKDYELLKKVSKERIKKANRKDVRRKREYLHQYIIFAVGCGCRVGEMMSLRHKAVERVSNYLRLTVSGKTGAHETTTMPSARDAYESLIKHNKKWNLPSGENDLVFPENPFEGLKGLLKEAGLYEDKLGRPRNAKNFRHTYIMFRILNSENLNLKAIADNLSTSVQTIDSHYAEVSNRLNEKALVSMKQAMQ